MIHQILSPAKINLYLKVTGIDPVSRYHFLDSIMVPVTLYDTISIEESENFCVEMVNSDVDVPTEDNIVYKIFKALEKNINRKLPNFHIRIDKNIPSGAGMGGGSGNGASFLLFINKHLNIGLTKEKMSQIASEVGSDIPFFIFESPAVVQGLGEIIKPITLSGLDAGAVLIFPGFQVNTRFAYSLIDKKILTREAQININTDRVKNFSSLKDWLSFIDNDFEDPVFEIHPELCEIKNALLEYGAESSFMTGSGSTMVGLFSNRDLLRNAVSAFSKKYKFVREVELIT